MKVNADLKVNFLPVLTYRWLQLNEGGCSIQGALTRPSAFAVPKELPQGVTAERNCPEERVRALFARTRERRARLDEERVLPNGDQSARDLRQTVPTGMGIDTDELFARLGIGSDIYTVAAGTDVKTPLMLRFHMADGDGLLSRQVVHVGENATLSVLMDYRAAKDAEGLLGIQTRFLLEKGAKLCLVKAQMLGRHYIHFDDIGGICEENASADIIQLELGGESIWNGVQADLLERDAAFHEYTGYLCREKQFYDMNYVMVQHGMKTTSELHFDGVLLDEAEKNFRGTIDFRKGSVGAAGEENEDTLLLSPQVVNRTIPLILCQEEDVNGHHGATIGQLSEELLFYMEARGIDAEEAKKLMIRARLDHIARMIPENHLRGATRDFIRKVL